MTSGPTPLWQIELKTEVTFMDPYIEVFDSGAIASSWQLYDEDTHVHFQAIYDDMLVAQRDHARLLLVADGMEDKLIQLTRAPVPAMDWVAFYAQSTPAFTIDKFYIYGSHLNHQPIPDDYFPLWVDAATAFGSGEHATTAGCLSALTRVAMEEKMAQAGSVHVFRGRPIHTILDMGCGTGILALGAAHLWPHAHILAGDIDAEAVRVTQVNVERNKANIRVVECQGFSSQDIQEKAPYDLIVANILAGPLCDMAPHMRQVVAPGSQVVLSGLLTHQADAVLAAYEAQGFKSLFTLKRENWSTLVLGLPQ